VLRGDAARETTSGAAVVILFGPSATKRQAHRSKDGRDRIPWQRALGEQRCARAAAPILTVDCGADIGIDVVGGVKRTDGLHQPPRHCAPTGWSTRAPEQSLKRLAFLAIGISPVRR